jgi:hypothetical protein
MKKVDTIIDEPPASLIKWTVVNFGKFADKHMTLPQIILNDPDWFWYMVERKAFTGTLASEAADIAARARKVRIPGKSPKRWKVLNYLTPEGAFSHFEVIEAQTACDRVSAKTRVTDFIDLSLPHRLKSYDKKGGKRLIKGLKYQLYGRTNVRLTKRRCEEFFADPGNLAKQRYWLELTGWAGL